MSKTSTRVYPVILGVRDPHAKQYAATAPIVIPEVADWAPVCSPIEDQGDTSSCTAHAITGRLEHLENIEKEHFVRLSRLFVYWNERFMEHDTNKDAGAIIANGIRSVCVTGVCTESLWPFDPKELYTKPTVEAFSEAYEHKGLDAHVVNQTENDLVHCIAAGNSIVFGVSIYDSFESDEVMKTGLVPMPGPRENCLGGHAILIVGYDLKKRLFKIRNSWGPDVGDHGYFYLPFDYVLNSQLASDFWLISRIS